jgi:hypothetical protein
MACRMTLDPGEEYVGGYSTLGVAYVINFSLVEHVYHFHCSDCERQKAPRRAWTSVCRERVGLQSGIRIMMTLAMSSFTSSLFEQVEMPCLSNCMPGDTF